MILIVDPEQPLIRTQKGAVRRKATIKVYDAKIDLLYVSCVLLRTTVSSLFS